MTPTFEQTYKDYYKLVLNNFKHFPKEEAEEYAQEVYLRLYKSYNNYDPAHKMSSFVVNFIIQVKADISDYNKCKLRNEVELVYDDEQQLEDFANCFAAGEARKDLLVAFKGIALSNTERTVIALILEDNSLPDISKILDKSYDSVKRTYYDILKKVSNRDAA
jgi:RNA polymerase sigma factor (sigma-70 family)